MSYSKCLGSNRGPLWVAAFCFKQLKKSQLLDTDISDSVDKILHDEMNAVSYRVLAYLLLGIVRIYSKKVEYLLHDCNEVLTRIKKFLIKTKDTALVETLRMSIIIPDRFELDAFDLDILEDAGGGHIAPPEEITLKDVLCNTEGFGQFSLDKFEKFDFGQSSCTADHHLVEDECHSHQMDFDYEVFLPNSPTNVMEATDTSQSILFSPKEPMNFGTALFNEGVEKEFFNTSSQDQQINEDQGIHVTVPYENEIHEERSRISSKGSVDVSMYSGREKEPVLSVEACHESHQVDEEQSMAIETSSSLCQVHQEIKEARESRNFQESIERPQEDKSYSKECMDYGKSSVTSENLEEHVEGSIEQHEKERRSEFQEKVLLEDDRLDVTPLESKNLDVTPQSKFQGGSVGKPKRGSVASEIMLIRTPAKRERAFFSRTNKIVIDQKLVLSNEELRKSIDDASELISNRRKFRGRTLLALQKQSRISRLSEGFHESLFPCSSEDLHFLFSKKKMKLSDSLEIVKSQEQLDVFESQTVGNPEHTATAPQSPPDCPGSIENVEIPEKLDVLESRAVGSPEHSPGSIENVEIPEKLDVLESQAVGSPEHIETAPRTPPRFPKINVRSIDQPERTETQNSDNLGPSSPLESIERERSLKRDSDLNLMEEEINSCETENSEFFSGWSERTRKVARYLHRSFLDLSKQRDEGIVDFSEVLRGRIRKECSRLFYEILVLKTTSYVDVKQKYAYGDIAVCKLQKLDQTFGANDP